MSEIYTNDALIRIILAIIIGALAAIVYSLRVLVLMERRVARMDINIEKMALQTLKEEKKIEKVLKKKK
jgi:uncharacterized membrane protein